MDHKELVKICKALANENRLDILHAIIEAQAGCCCPSGDMEASAPEEGGVWCVDDLVSRFDMAQSTVSQHLKELHNAGLLERRKCAQWVYYTVGPKLLEFAEYMRDCCNQILGGEIPQCESS